MKDLLAGLRKRFGQRGEPVRLVIDDIGFCIIDRSKTAARIRWDEVQEVFAFKEDCGMYDDICLGFRVDEKGTYWKVSEEVVGFKALLEELERRFPEILTDWFSDVAFPAFKTNRRTLWTRSPDLS